MSRSYRGGTAKFYQEDSWTDGSDIPTTPSWTEWKRLIDVSVSATKGEANVSSREADYVLRVGGLKDLSITAGYRLRRLADAIWDALVTDWINDTPILIAMMSDDIANSGAKGWQVPVLIMEASEDQPNEDGAQGNLSIAPTDARDAAGALILPTRLVTP